MENLDKKNDMNEDELEKLERRLALESRLGDLNRARSITVGTAFGGVTEISMRSNKGESVWCILQPVEVVELVHQLTASIGCHIHIYPRNDFASWRDWKYTEEQLAHYRGENDHRAVGWAPHAKEMSTLNQIRGTQPILIEQPKKKVINKQNVKKVDDGK